MELSSSLRALRALRAAIVELRTRRPTTTPKRSASLWPLRTRPAHLETVLGTTLRRHRSTELPPWLPGKRWRVFGTMHLRTMHLRTTPSRVWHRQAMLPVALRESTPTARRKLPGLFAGLPLRAVTALRPIPAARAFASRLLLPGAVALGTPALGTPALWSTATSRGAVAARSFGPLRPRTISVPPPFAPVLTVPPGWLGPRRTLAGRIDFPRLDLAVAIPIQRLQARRGFADFIRIEHAVSIPIEKLEQARHWALRSRLRTASLFDARPFHAWPPFLGRPPGLSSRPFWGSSGR